MMRHDDWYGNAVIESSSRDFKQESVSQHLWDGLTDARAPNYDDIEVFNTPQHLHSALCYKMPWEADRAAA